MAALHDVKHIILDLMAAYPDWKPPNLEATVKQYEEALRGYPVDLLKRAADRCRDSCLFFPKIAEIIKAINTMQASDIANTNTPWPEDVRVGPISNKIQEYLDDFRAAMVQRGIWKEAHPDARGWQ